MVWLLANLPRMTSRTILLIVSLIQYCCVFNCHFLFFCIFFYFWYFYFLVYIVCFVLYLHCLCVLQQLNWLPIKHCIDFKIASITFRTLHFPQPAYLRSSLHACHSTRSLRLSNTNLLSAPFVRTLFGSRSFSVSAPKTRTLSLYLSVPVPVLTPFVVTSRPSTASRPSNPVDPSLLAPQIRLS